MNSSVYMITLYDVCLCYVCVLLSFAAPGRRESIPTASPQKKKENETTKMMMTMTMKKKKKEVGKRQLVRITRLSLRKTKQKKNTIRSQRENQK